MSEIPEIEGLDDYMTLANRRYQHGIEVAADRDGTVTLEWWEQADTFLGDATRTFRFTAEEFDAVCAMRARVRSPRGE